MPGSNDTTLILLLSKVIITHNNLLVNHYLRTALFIDKKHITLKYYV